MTHLYESFQVVSSQRLWVVPNCTELLTSNANNIAGYCARAASGHAAAAPPSVAKNFRRPMWLAM